MKLPKEYDMYDHNRFLDKVLCKARGLAEDLPPAPFPLCDAGKNNVCRGNLKHIRELMADLTHLELALEEILNLRSER